MISGLQIEQKALEDIKRHFEYLREYNPDRAKRFVLAFETTCLEMVQAPLLGSPRFYEDPRLHSLRSWPIKGLKTIC